jgi:hypothetical protein
MLELRPTCENCNKALPPQSLDARICTFECTFCAVCVDEVIKNVCPNCAGGFCPKTDSTFEAVARRVAPGRAPRGHNRQASTRRHSEACGAACAHQGSVTRRAMTGPRRDARRYCGGYARLRLREH